MAALTEHRMSDLWDGLDRAVPEWFRHNPYAEWYAKHDPPARLPGP